MAAEKFVQTVTGLVPSKELGVVMSHEHLFIDLNWPQSRRDPATGRAEYFTPIDLANRFETSRHHNRQDDRLLVSFDDTVQELRLLSAMGGGTVIDATSIGLGRDPLALARASSVTGMKVVMGTGYYVHQFHPESVASMTTTEITDEIVHDLAEGADGTAIKSGVIGEIGMSSPAHPDEIKILKASAMAQQQTGAPLLIHPGRSSQSPQAHLMTVDRAGGAPERTVIAHIERTLFDAKSIAQVLESGCFVAFDLFGRESSFHSMGDIDMPNDARRVDLIIELAELGHLDQILISQDICYKTLLRKYGGHGYAHILENIVPLMKRKGLDQPSIDRLLIHNAANALSFK